MAKNRKAQCEKGRRATGSGDAATSYPPLFRVVDHSDKLTEDQIVFAIEFFEGFAAHVDNALQIAAKLSFLRPLPRNRQAC